MLIELYVKISSFIGIVFLGLFVQMLMSPRNYGASVDWTGSGSDDLFSTSANWTTPPVDGDSVFFGSSPRYTPSVDTSFVPNQMVFNLDAGAYTFSGSSLSLGSGGLQNNSTNIQTFNLPLTLTSDQSFAASSGNFQFNGAIALGSSQLTLVGSANQTLAGAVSGSGSLRLSGGTTTLGASNSFSGGLHLDAGVLQFTNNNQLGAASGDLFFQDATLYKTSSSGSITLGAGRTLHINPAGNATVRVQGGNIVSNTNGQWSVAGDGRLFKSGNGTLSIRQANPDFDGQVTIQAGILEIRNLNSLGDASDRAKITMSGGTLRTYFNGDSDFAHDLEVTGNATLNVRRTNASGGSSFTHRFGDLVISNNRLSVSSDSGSKYRAQVDSIALLGNANFNVNGNSGFIVDGNVTGSFGFTKSGAGSMTLSGASANTYTGTTTVSAGTLELAKPAGTNAIPGNLTIGGGTTVVRLLAAEQIADSVAVTVTGRLDLNNHDEKVRSLSGAGTVTLGSGQLTIENTGSQTFSGVISGTGGVVKQGSGSLSLSGVNTFTGPIQIAGGTLLLGNNQRLADAADLHLAGGTFATGGFSETVNSLVLTEDSTLNLGSGASVVNFATDNLASGKTLTVTNWSGAVTGGGTDRLIFGSTLTPTSLSGIKFLNPLGFAAGLYDPIARS